MAEDRVSVWEYVKPGNVIGSYIEPFTSPTQAFIYGPYRSLARGTGFFPGIIPTQGWMSTGTKMPGSVAKLADAIGSSSLMRGRVGSVGRYLGTAGRFLLFGGSRDLGPEARMVADVGMDKAVAMKFGSSERQFALSKVLSKYGGGTTAMNTIRAKALLIGAARVINPIINLYMGYQALSWAVESTYKGIKTTAAVIDRARSRMTDLELGGALSQGFLSEQGATERQRALQAIQSSHLSGRRFMGNEASMYHA